MKTIFNKLIGILAITLIAFVSCTQSGKKPEHPNVVIIYIDDLGYGDVSCYGATEISTPNIDKLAENGILFTDGHCSSSTCTPSRYSMLTGNYAWRTEGTGIARGDAGMIINTETRTLADVFNESGYSTAVVGKWHLGLGPEEGPDWNGYISPGPQDIGFDYSFLIPATGDRVPCVYTEDGRIVGLDPNDSVRVSYRENIGDEPTGKENRDQLMMDWAYGHNHTIVNGISRIGYMSGGKSARWIDEDMADVITDKALDFIEKNKEEPFFLYYSTHDIHVPRVPHARFVGKSGMGPRGDAILEVDWATGAIMDKLEELGLTENTIVIFTSDNGPVLNDGYKDQAKELLGDHKPAGIYKGGKYSAFEAGTRIPFIVSWPAEIAPGKSDALVNQIDFLSSFANLLDKPLAENDAKDSQDLLDVFLGKSPKGREFMVEHGISTLSLVKGDWKYFVPNPKHKSHYSIPHLYNLKEDPSETNNLAEELPEKLKELEDLMNKIKEDGRERF